MNYVIVVGNLGRDPELAFSASGKAVCKMSVGSKERGHNGQEDVMTWHNVVVFNDLAENVAASVSKGDRVIVIGRVRKHKWEKKDGTTGYSEEIRADEVGINLRFTVATPLRAGASSGQQGQSAVGDPEEPF